MGTTGTGAYVNTSGNPQTVPYYGTTGTSGIQGQQGATYATTGATGGYGSGYYSSGTGTGARQEIKQTVTEIKPNQTVQTTYRESSGPTGGTYERKTVEQSSYAQPATTTYPAYQAQPQQTNTYVQGQSNYTRPAAVAVPVQPATTTTTYYQQPAPVAVAAAPTKNRCPKPLLALLGLLGLAGVILGLLFGLGVIGGKRGDLTPPAATATPGYAGPNAYI